MAAYTTTTTGNWSSTATWGGSGPPGDGDTVTMSYNVTVDVNTTVGSSPNTGGTAAILMSTASRTVTLTIGTGITLTCKGDITQGATYLTQSSIVMNAGATITLFPPSGQTYYINCNQDLNSITCNGTSGSGCTIQTNLTSAGLNGSIVISTANRNQGVITATYTTFENMGTSSVIGVNTHLDYPTASANSSITNCTFTGSSYGSLNGYQNGTWTGTQTFSNNTFSSSVGYTLNIAGVCAGFGAYSASTGTITIQNNSFDLAVVPHDFSGSVLTCTDNYFGSTVLGACSWTSATQFTRNFITFNFATASPPSIGGPISNCYINVVYSASNAHHLTTNGSGTFAVSGCIFDPNISSGGGGVGIVLPAPTANSYLTLTNNIVCPGGGGYGSCFSGPSTSGSYSWYITAVHNTVCLTGPYDEPGMLYNASSLPTGAFPSVQANLCWQAGTTYTGNLAVYDASNILNAVTLAGNNAFYNPTTGTCYYNTSTSQSGVTGYSGVKISANTAYPNATVGNGDITANPQFVDSTRSLATWSSQHGGSGTYASGAALIAANTTLIGQATTGLLAWVKAGFEVQNVSYVNASYSGDPSTSDAAGNAWPGGGPGLGAMVYSSGAVQDPIGVAGPLAMSVP